MIDEAYPNINKILKRKKNTFFYLAMSLSPHHLIFALPSANFFLLHPM